MARRWILFGIIAALLVVVAVVAARAIHDDDTETTGRATTTTSGVTTSSGSPGTTTSTTTASTTTSIPTSTTGPPGPCGTDTGPIRTAIDAAVTGAAENADVATCRLAASDPSWAAVNLAAKAGSQFDAITVIAHGGAGSWSVVAQGGTNAGCGAVPQQVIVDLGQFCAGTGGNGAQ